jgi:glycosyltransferase involved in cell wall biosynthesis
VSATIRLVRALRQRLAPSRVSLEAIEPQSIASNQPDAGAAVRWIDPVSIKGVLRQALLCHPDSTVTYTLDPPRAASVVAWCALHPESWSANRGGVRFTLTVKSAGFERMRSIVMDPRGRTRDRTWRPLRAELPREGGSDVEVTLATSLPPGAAPAHAWAVWGDPHVSWKTPLAAKVASGVGAIKLLGVGGAIRRLGQVSERSEGPQSAYRSWLTRHTLDADGLQRLACDVSALPFQPVVSVLMPVFNTPPVWLTRAIDSVRRQVYPHWQLSICDDGSRDEGTRAVLARIADDARITIDRLERNQGISAASNAALANARGEWIALLDHDDELAPEALAELVRTINRHPDTDVAYSDEDKIDQSGQRCDPFFKPDWAPEHLLSCMYTCHLFAARKALVDEAGGFRIGYEGSQDYDLMLRLSDRTSRIRHIPRVLYHWRKTPASVAGAGLAKPWAIDAGHRALADYARRNCLDAEILAGPSPGRYRVRRRVPPESSVSVVIGAFDPVASIAEAEALISRIARDGGSRIAEILVIRRPARDERAPSSGTRIVDVSPGASPLAAVNAAGRGARGDHLLFLAPRLEPVVPGWIDALLEHSIEPGVGAVGGKLLDHEGRLRHIGIVLGLKGLAASPFAGYPAAMEGYISSAVGTRNYSAVSGACLMTRRAVFETLHGFDERAGLTHAALDYCLRAGRAGHRVVFTPYASLRETAASSTVDDVSSTELIRARWADVIDNDPFYNPNLSRDFLDCRPRS